MRKIMGYVLGLVATLGAAGAIATTANADGSSADADSGSGSATTASAVTPATGSSETGSSDASSAESVPSDSVSAASASSDATSSATSSTGEVTHVWFRWPHFFARHHVDMKKIMGAEAKMRGHDHYYDGERIIKFKKGQKGAEVVLRNRRGREIERFRVRRDGRFDIKLSKREARDLRKGGKYFTFTVHEKGYRPYTVRYVLYK